MEPEGRNRERWWIAGFGALLVLQLFVLMPLTLYAGNADEFSNSLRSILSFYVKPATFLFFCFAFVSVLVPRRWVIRLGMVFAALNVVLWLQGNLLVWDYGLLDGHAIDWTKASWRGWVDAAAWALPLLLALIAPVTAAKVLRLAALVAFAAMTGGALSAAMHRSEALGGRGLARSDTARNAFYRFSSSRNVLHIVVDGVQGDVFGEILANRTAGGQRIETALGGFVHFPDHLGAFPFTHMSVPAILSGKRYGNEVPRGRFLDEAVGNGSTTILNAAHNAGFEVDLAVAEGIEHLYTRGAADNVYPLGGKLHARPADFAAQQAASLFDLTLFRISPHLLKPLIYNDQKWLVQTFLVEEDYLNLRFFSHMAFLDDMRSRMTADRPEPVYKLMHVMVSHTPFAVTPDCNYAGRVLPTERDSVTAQTRCGLFKVVQLLERMKELGIYDSTTIVLMADHGGWVPPLRFKMAEGAYAQPDTINPVVALGTPLFAVKPAGSVGPLRTSLAPSWIVDTAATVAAAAGIEGDFPGVDALSLAPDSPRVRSFRTYKYRNSEWTDQYLTPIYEFEVKGPVLEGASWSYHRTLMPPE